MKTTDLFTRNRSAQRLNESLSKMFGTQLDLDSFDTPKLEDARNKLRTQIHTARQESGFNETIENETLSKAQFMHDAIVAELMDRQEHIVDTTVEEGAAAGYDPETQARIKAATPQQLSQMAQEFAGGPSQYQSELKMLQQAKAELSEQLGEGADIDRQELMSILKRFDENMNEIGGYGDPDFDKILAALNQGDVESAVEEVYGNYSDQDGGEIRSNDFDNYLEDLEDQFKEMVGGSDDDEGGETDDAYALSSAGFGSDEDYESIETEVAQAKTDDNFRAYLAQRKADKGGRDAYQRDYDSSVSGMGRSERDPADWDEGNTEPPNNFAVSINGKKWKVFKGRGKYAEDAREQAHYEQLKDWARKKSESTGKNWTVSITGENPTESIQTELSKNTLKSYQDKAGKDIVNTMTSGDYMTTDKSQKKVMNRMKGSQRADNKIDKKNESINTGEDMRNLREGEVQQASAIVTAKTMVDRVSRWIEELSGMENDTLLQLGDSIRDEMSAEQAKTFISSVAPAIQQALENLKTTRETLSTGVRLLTGEEQGAEMLGGEPAGMGGDEMGPAEPDAMNMGGDMGDAGGEDEFAAAEPAAGGLGDAGREQRESINRSSSLLKVLAG